MLFETARGGKYLTDEKPEAVYDVIETMLHEAVYVEGKQDGSLLELYQTYICFRSFSHDAIDFLL